jgi:hypothetical protein
MSYNPEDVSTWPGYLPVPIIAHDVGRSRDRSTAVVGGVCPYGPSMIGIGEAEELPQGLFGSARASALAAVDRRYGNCALIVADISNDATYGEVLREHFGPRVIGLHITRNGDGMVAERRATKVGNMLVYTIGRTFLIELLHTALQNEELLCIDSPMMRRAYAQLDALELELRDTGAVYKCPEGLHDDLGISMAMLVWAARHPHLDHWVGTIRRSCRPPRRRPQISSLAWT